jgi:hypothetical protein
MIAVKKRKPKLIIIDTAALPAGLELVWRPPPFFDDPEGFMTWVRALQLCRN